ncbi:hypothetical protein [Anaerocolumna sp. MB42-C2]|uniref:hypothetical protein n=1 Tax=Anaerocolumna sp. MB42-C2 TaxID=3070997 RepID=UPI0027DFB3C7|nr:hypothetical protein [Anaerocolumna sp. MB42-C2]WMJ88042.1 hypothetical protein RBU59_00650 [Anaerocolumna sp. MB42-C2]
MLADLLTNEMIWNTYIKYFLLPIEPIIPWVVIFAVTVFIFNKVLDYSYYRFIRSGSSRALSHKKWRILCPIYNFKSSNKYHNTYK